MVLLRGVPQFFLRGQTQTVKRKFVEVPGQGRSRQRSRPLSGR